MKKLILLYPSNERGGVKRNFLSFVKIIKNKNINTEIITDKNLKKKYLNNKIKIHLINKKNFLFINYKILSSFFGSILLLKLFLKFGSKKKLVLSFQSSFFASIVCFFSGVKIVVRVSEDPLEATIFGDNLLNSYLIFLSKIITYNFSTKILVNSKKMKKNVGKITLNKNKIYLMYNMNLEKIEQNKFAYKKNIFLNVGRLCKQKNQLLILHAFKKLNNVNKKYKLIFCGDGPDKSKLVLLSKKLKLNKYVIFNGWQKDIDKIYNKSKFFILPSLYEGLPNSLIDAINFELVSICSDVSGVRDICGNSSLILKNKSVDELEKKMTEAVYNYKYYYQKTITQKKKIKKFLFKNLENNVKKNILNL